MKMYLRGVRRTELVQDRVQRSAFVNMAMNHQVGKNWPVILPETATSMPIQGSFTCRKSATWDPRLYFPSEGRRAEDFFTPKNPDGFGRV